MGSRLLVPKKLGARISLATLTAQIALGSLTLGLAPVAIAHNGATPTCNGFTASVWVNHHNVIVGGPNDGAAYAGVLNGTTSSDVIVGTTGDDEIHGNDGTDLICGDAGNDEIYGEADSDDLWGDDGNDVLDGGGGTDTLRGRSGNDELRGGGGADILNGGAGHDVLRGEGGSDNLDGQAGNDNCYGGGQGGDVSANCESAAADKGIVIINKDAQPNHADIFTFTGLGGFTLQDDGDEGTNPSQYVVYRDAGTYNVTETSDPDWNIDDVSCIDADGTTVPNAAGGSASISIDAGEVVECTFTNVLPDADEDGVPDVSDNCVNDANAGQEDDDSDGVGDACETSSMVVVKSSALNGWTLTESDTTTSADFVYGAGTPPLGVGSVQLAVGPDGNDDAQARTASYDNVLLSDIEELSYSTYVSEDGSGGQMPYIILNVDTNGDSTADDRLFFEPVYQTGTYGGDVVPNQCGGNPNCVLMDTWRTWNALEGGWWSLNDATYGPPLKTLATYIAANPTARIVNGTSAGGLRMVVGGGAGAWDDFVGNVDEFVIQVNGVETTYDFEPTDMVLGYETSETQNTPGIGSCPVTASDLSQANGTASLQHLEWTYFPGADHYDVYGYSWNGTSWSGGSPYSLSNLEGSSQDIDEANGTYTYKAFATNEGTYGYQIKAIDAYGNVLGQTAPVVDETFTCTFTVDRPDAPTSLPTPTLEGWNVQGESATLDETPVDLTCGASINNGQNSLNQMWTAVSGTNVKYIRRVSADNGANWNELTGLVYSTNHMNGWNSFGPSEGGTYLTGVMAFQDANSNNALDMGELASDWSNDCQITYANVDPDTTAPAIPTHLSPENNSTHTSAALTMSDWTTVTDDSEPVTYIYQSSLSTATNPDGSFVSPAYTSGPLSASEIAHSGTPEGTYYWHVKAIDAEGNESAWSDYWTLTVDNTPGPVTVTITKYLDEALATAGTFPMHSVWSDTEPNFGGGEGDYSLNAGNSYQAVTSEMPAGANYSTYETASSECTEAYPYELVGYTTGNTMQQAIDGTPTMTQPSFTDLMNNKYVIVWNETCDEVDENVTVNITKFLDGEIATAESADGTSFPMHAVWSDTEPNFGGGEGDYVLGATGHNPSAGDGPYEATTAEMPQGSNYSTYETASGMECTEDYPYELVGYTKGDTYEEAAEGTPTLDTPSFTDLEDDKFVIVWNRTCGEEPVACVVSDDYLVAHWQLDEATEATTASDASGNGNNGTVNGASSDAAGAPGVAFANEGSYDFDGTDDSVSMGSNVGNFSLATPFSVAAWINSSLDGENHAIYGNTWSNAGYLLRVTTDNKIRFIVVENGSVYEGVDSNVLSSGWHHVVGTWDGTDVHVYVDGVEQSITPIANGTVTTISTSNGTSIGSTGQAGSEQFFDGTIDDVRVYSVALNGTQAAALAGGACNAGVVAPPEEEDTDTDGIADEDDNCPLTINPGQADNDEDGLGNECDSTPNGNEGSDGGDGGETQTQGFSAPETNGSNGARRGKQTNILNSLIGLFGGDGEQGDVPPGGFGGPGEEEFTEEETDVICRMRKALPENASSAVREWVAQELAAKMPHSAEAIAEELKTGSICPKDLVRTKAQAAPIAFRVDAQGFPVSSNDTWNKCVRGTATLEDIRNNPDRDNDGYGVSCSRYHTSSLWRHPDLGVYFTWKRQGKAVGLPVGYVLKQDGVAQK